MTYPESHVQEQLRLQALKSYDILDSLPEKAYDNLTAMAAQICETPISLISLIDDSRQWFKSHHGLEVLETPREYAFCAHAINHPEDIVIVPDSRNDPRFMNNPLVTGSPNIIFYAGVPLRDDDNMPIGTFCIIDNKPRVIDQNQINALKSLANQVMNLLSFRKLTAELTDSISGLSKKNNDLEQFAFVAAHDLKSPLINIYSIAKLFLDCYGHVLEAEGKTMIAHIQRASEKLRGLIDDILAYSRSEFILQEELSIIDLQKFRNEIYELFSDDRTFTLNLKTTLNSITTNQAALNQILTNLISNAIRYNDKEKVIVEIGITESENFIELCVLDNGPGIPRELQENAFELFKVLSDSDKNGVKGSGVGLATVKKLVEGLGGTIQITSEPGSGCKFTMNIKKKGVNPERKVWHCRAAKQTIVLP